MQCRAPARSLLLAERLRGGSKGIAACCSRVCDIKGGNERSGVDIGVDFACCVVLLGESMYFIRSFTLYCAPKLGTLGYEV